MICRINNEMGKATQPLYAPFVSRWQRRTALRLGQGLLRTFLANLPDDAASLIENKDKKRADRTIQAMLKMKKLNIAKLKKAYAGRGK